MIQDVPIVGKWYIVIKGVRKGFIGECVTFDIKHELPVILQDLNYNGAACRVNEIKPTVQQIGTMDLHRTQLN